MSIYLNVFSTMKYPERIAMVSLEYSDYNYEKYKF